MSPPSTKLVAASAAGIAAGWAAGWVIWFAALRATPDLALLTFILGAPVSLGLAAVVGAVVVLLLWWPTHALLLRAGWRGLAWYSAAGLVLGSALTGLAWLASTEQPALDPAVTQDYSAAMNLFWVAAATAGAVAFWLVRRPDRASEG